MSFWSSTCERTGSAGFTRQGRTAIYIPVDFLPSGLLVALATNARGFMQLATVDLRTGETSFVGPDDWDVEHAAVAVHSGAVLASRNVHGESEVLAFTGDWNRPVLVCSGGVIEGIAIDADGRSRVLWERTQRMQMPWISLMPLGFNPDSPAFNGLGRCRTPCNSAP